VASNQLHLVIVVSGAPQALSINPHETLEHAVREALRESGNQGRSPAEFELRNQDGALLDQAQRPSDVGVHDGQTLFLNPHAGAGG
jgi:hypothetical protein